MPAHTARLFPAAVAALLLSAAPQALAQEAAATQLRLGHVPHPPGPPDTHGLRLSWQSQDGSLDSVGDPAFHADLTPVPGDVVGSLGLSFGALEMTWSQSLERDPTAPPTDTGGQAWMGFSFRF